MKKTTHYWDYKSCVKDRMKELRRNRAAMTQTFIADKLDLQPSYLSRVLNDEKAQFSEDQLYRLLEVLQFASWERDYLILLRTYETTSLPNRRAEIEGRIREIQSGDQVSDLNRLKEELKRVVSDIHAITRNCAHLDSRVKCAEEQKT